jgi:hypothetical protein
MTEKAVTYYSGLKVPPFNGKKNNWDAWEEKFLARAKHKGYKDVLLGSAEIPTDDEELDPEDEDDKIKMDIKERNEVAYGKLILMIDTEKSNGKVAFNIVKRSRTSKYLDGNAEVAWKGLERKYKPTMAPSLAKLHKQFYSAKLKKKVDPDIFITYLEDLRTPS